MCVPNEISIKENYIMHLKVIGGMHFFIEFNNSRKNEEKHIQKFQQILQF